jgi:hypothetical protein
MKEWTDRDRLMLQLELEKLDRRLAGCQISHKLKREAHDIIYDAIDACSSTEHYRDAHIDFSEESFRKKKR